MHGLHNLFVESMGFAPIPGKHLVVPTFVEVGAIWIPESLPMARLGVRGNVFKGHSTNLGSRSEEAFFNHFIREAYGLKNLSTAITAHGGNAHLGHDFEHAVLNGRSVIGNRLFDGNVQFAVLSPLADQINRKIRIDRRGTATDQTGKMMYIPSLTRLADNG